MRLFLSKEEIKNNAKTLCFVFIGVAFLSFVYGVIDNSGAGVDERVKKGEIKWQNNPLTGELEVTYICDSQYNFLSYDIDRDAIKAAGSVPRLL